MTKFVKLNMLAAVGLAVVVSSCGTSNEVVSGGIFTKRKHTRGYHVNLPGKFKGTKSTTTEVNADELVVETVEKATTYAVQTAPAVSEDRVELPAQYPAVEAVEAAQEKAAVTPTVESRIAAIQKVSSSKAAAKTAVAEKVFKNKINKIEKKTATPLPVDTILLVVLAILIPPLAVYLSEGSITGTFWLNLVLTLLCGLPGVIHALIVVLR